MKRFVLVFAIPFAILVAVAAIWLALPNIVHHQKIVDGGDLLPPIILGEDPKQDSTLDDLRRNIFLVVFAIGIVLSLVSIAIGIRAKITANSDGSMLV